MGDQRADIAHGARAAAVDGVRISSAAQQVDVGVDEPGQDGTAVLDHVDGCAVERREHRGTRAHIDDPPSAHGKRGVDDVAASTVVKCSGKMHGDRFRRQATDLRPASHRRRRRSGR